MGNRVMGKGCIRGTPLCVRSRRRGSGYKQSKGAVRGLAGLEVGAGREC